MTGKEINRKTPEPANQMLENHDSTQELYNRTASRWVRTEPLSLSDFTARPSVLALCEPIQGVTVLDLGCGEGYCSRELRRRGAKKVCGIDLSEGMIEAAQQQEIQEPLGIEYRVGCATNLSQFPPGAFDLVLAVFLFNYLSIDQMQQCMTEVVRVLRPGGQFVFSVPHPAFPFMRSPEPPFYFQVEDAGYFTHRDSKFPGQIWKRDGSYLPVQLIHKTFQDYFNSLQKTGFQSMPTVIELGVTSEHIALDEKFFKPLFNYPLHVAIKVSR